jgi:hypothetical protein
MLTEKKEQLQMPKTKEYRRLIHYYTQTPILSIIWLIRQIEAKLTSVNMNDNITRKGVFYHAHASLLFEARSKHNRSIRVIRPH